MTKREALPLESEDFPSDFSERDVEVSRRVLPFTMTSPERVYALRRALEYLTREDVDGAIVECGVWRGGSMMAAALTLLELGRDEYELWLYDTFAGMTLPGSEDIAHSGKSALEWMEETKDKDFGYHVASLEEVREAMASTQYPQERLRFVQGPVEGTIPAQAPDRIALLRLDTDWYESTAHELEHLYPRLAKGGVLIVDDYGHWQGSQKAVDEFIERNALPLLLNRVDYSCRIAVKP